MRTAPGCVLIVSAEDTVGEPIRQALLRLGLTGIVTSSAADAIHRLPQDKPLAIIVDFELPGTDPIQVVQRARACRETRGAAVLALAGDDSADFEALLAGGCTTVLPRAADPRDVAYEVAERLKPAC